MATKDSPATTPVKKEPSQCDSMTMEFNGKQKEVKNPFVNGKFGSSKKSPMKFAKGKMNHRSNNRKKGSADFVKGKFDPERKKKKKNFAKKLKGGELDRNNITQRFFSNVISAGDMKVKRAKLSPAYFDAVAILRKMSLKKGSINGLIGALKNQKNIKQVYALAINVIKNQEVIKQIVEQFPPPSNFDPLFIEVLIADMLIGTKRFVKYRASPETSFVLENETKMKTYYGQIKDNEESKSSIVELPVRYIRINLIKTSKNDLIEMLKAEQYILKSYSKKKTSFEDFMELARNLDEMEFMSDWHFDDVLLFRNADSKKLTKLQLFRDYMFAIQDKSSMLAIEAMSLQPGMTILDACAAPGMKTIAIASRLNNDCTLYANDMDTKRYKQMRTFLHKYGVQTEKLSNVDFSQLDPSEYSNLDVILLDPSCSGSGMVRRFDYGEKKADEEQAEKRLSKLATFQLALLETALKFKPKKIVYCTCSKLQRENEDVISQLLRNTPKIKYEVVDPMPGWPTRGTGDYEFSSMCLRADMDSTLTCGFFCCVLQRKEGAVDEEEEEECEGVSNEEQVASESEPEQTQTQTQTQTFSQPKSTRKSSRISKRKTSNPEESDVPSESTGAEEEDAPTLRKSKRLRK